MKTTSTTSPEIEPLLTAKEVMPWLGYADTDSQRISFWQFARRNHLPYIEIGQRRRAFDRRQVQAWLDARQKGFLYVVNSGD